MIANKLGGEMQPSLQVLLGVSGQPAFLWGVGQDPLEPGKSYDLLWDNTGWRISYSQLQDRELWEDEFL
jgi:hypothetical protein